MANKFELSIRELSEIKNKYVNPYQVLQLKHNAQVVIKNLGDSAMLEQFNRLTTFSRYTIDEVRFEKTNNAIDVALRDLKLKISLKSEGSDLFETIKVNCIACKGLKNHKIKKQESRRIDDEEAEVAFFDEWQIIECAGCNSISFRHVSTNSDDLHPETGEPWPTINIYPFRGSDFLPIKPYYYTPNSVRSIYKETMSAYNNKLWILCASGLRAIIESICNLEGIKNGLVEKDSPKKDGTKITKRTSDLEGKINGLHEKGLLTRKQTEILHEHRFLGNKAIHNVTSPSKESLTIAIEIVEHILDALYEVTQKGDQLTSQRVSKSKK